MFYSKFLVRQRWEINYQRTAQMLKDHCNCDDKKRVGKDTVADYLVNKYGFVKYSFGQPIKEVAKIMFDFSDEQLNGDLKEAVDIRWGISPRQFFQDFGSSLSKAFL